MLVVIYGETRADVSRHILEAPVTRCVWRLHSDFEGPIGDACYAPDSPEIRNAYDEAGLEVVTLDKPKEKKKAKSIFRAEPEAKEVRDRDE